MSLGSQISSRMLATLLLLCAALVVQAGCGARFGSGRAGPSIDVLDGFVTAEGLAYGRPVGVALDKRGGLLVADDVGNVIWRVRAADGAQTN